MGCRGTTRPTNAFSHKWENHWAASALWYTYYSFCPMHRYLRVTPAIEAGIADHQLSIAELLA